MVRPSRYARRFTAATPFALGGPAAGHALMRTAADPAGRTVLGTFNNCASGMTPWGTYLSGEENFAYYFARRRAADRARAALGPAQDNAGYRWHEHDARFDAAEHPNEPNRFGWVVEIDPMDPTSTPVKRTALGRAAHEGAWVAVTQGRPRGRLLRRGRALRVHLQVRQPRRRSRPGRRAAQANRDLLDHGTLYVARFDADGSGRWLPLVARPGPADAANGFADQGEVVIKARQASDLLGAPRWTGPSGWPIDQQRG